LPSEGIELELDTVASDSVERSFEQVFGLEKVGQRLPPLTLILPPAKVKIFLAQT
jgi:hypothetical protein